MKRLLLAGLGPHEAAAMGIMLRMQWRDMEIVDLGRSADFELPQQGLASFCGVRRRRPTPCRSTTTPSQARATAAPMIRCRGSCNGSTDPIPARP